MKTTQKLTINDTTICHNKSMIKYATTDWHKKYKKIKEKQRQIQIDVKKPIYWKIKLKFWEETTKYVILGKKMIKKKKSLLISNKEGLERGNRA